MSTSTSDARREANRRNAQRSTGPKTEAGKARSRQNALTHGLTARVVDLDHSEVGGSAVGDAVAPVTAGWLAAEVTRTMAQITRAGRIESKLRDEAAWRAMTVWASDRQVAAEVLGAGLGRQPSVVVARLRLTPQGCDWLLERWGWLVRAAGAGWNEAQTHLAFDLLGIPPEGRTETVLDAVAHRRREQLEPAATPLVLAQQMLAELEAQREAVIEADEVAQGLAQAGAVDLPTPELARLRRYEGVLHRRLGALLGALPAPPAVMTNPAPATISVEPAEAPPLSVPPEEAAVSHPTDGDETKPTLALAEPTPTQAPPPAPIRHRPDLAQIVRRDRRQAQARKRRQHQAGGR